jgi:hypothetical protein
MASVRSDPDPEADGQSRRERIALFRWEWDMWGRVLLGPRCRPVSWDEAEQLYRELVEGGGTAG